MDVLLFYRSLTVHDLDHGPDMHRAPLSLLTIAASVRQAGYTADVYNLSHFSERGEDELLDKLPAVQRLMGLSQFTTNRHATYSLARKLRQRYPQIPIVVGGVHAALFPEEILRGHPEIDYVVVGEGDYTIQKLLRALCHKEDVQNVEGLAWRSGEQVHVNPGAAVISHLDELPYTQDYYANNFVLTSRGCPYPCTFCGANRNVRRKSVGRVMNELGKLIRIHGNSHVKFVDDLFACDDDRVKEMTEGISALPEPITYECNLRANTATERMVQNLVSSGCMMAYLGAESGSDDVLGAYRKGITAEQIIQAVKMCRAYGLRIGISLLFSKYDDEISFAQTRRVVEEAKPTDFSVCPVFLYPGIQLYREAVAAGEVDPGIWEQSDVAMPVAAFSGYPEKYARAEQFSARLRQCYRRLQPAAQYSSREYETVWKRHGYPAIGLKLAFRYLDENRFAASLELARELDHTGYDHLDVYSCKAFSLVGQGKSEQGRQTLLAWNERHPSSQEYRLRKGVLYEQLGRYDEAIEEYQSIRNPIDGGYEELLRIANAYEKAGAGAAALEMYRTIADMYHIYSAPMRHFVHGKIRQSERGKPTPRPNEGCIDAVPR